MNVARMILTILNLISNRYIIPKIQNQLTVSGTNEIKLNSNRPKEMVKNTKTMNPAAKSTKLKLSLSIFAKDCVTIRSS